MLNRTGYSFLIRGPKSRTNLNLELLWKAPPRCDSSRPLVWMWAQKLVYMLQSNNLSGSLESAFGLGFNWDGPLPKKKKKLGGICSNWVRLFKVDFSKLDGLDSTGIVSLHPPYSTRQPNPTQLGWLHYIPPAQPKAHFHVEVEMTFTTHALYASCWWWCKRIGFETK